MKECFHIHVALVPKKRNLQPNLCSKMICKKPVTQTAVKHDPFCHKCEVWCEFAIEQQNRPLFKNNTGCFGLTDNDELITRPLPKAPSHQGCDSEQGGSLDPWRASAGPKKRGKQVMQI